MSVDTAVPDYEELLRELGLVRENGLTALRGLNLPALHQAAAALGLIPTHLTFAPAALEELIGQAIDRFGRSRQQRAARYTFGLVGGARFEPAPVRRELAAKAWGVSSERFRRKQEPLIVGQTADAILALIYEAAMRDVQRVAVGSAGARLSDEPDLRDNIRGVQVPTYECEAAPSSPTRTVAVESALSRIAPRKRAGRSGRILRGVIATALAVEIVMASVVIARDDAAESAWHGMTATELEQRYDGKLPWGDDNDSRCANPPDAQAVASNTPPVMAPDGNQVGAVQLRKSLVCPTAVWARVLWHGDERGTYRIPRGWTLHSVVHRPDTKTSIDEQDHSSASDAPEIISRMIASASGCVFAEVYFTNDNEADIRTAVARTACVRG